VYSGKNKKNGYERAVKKIHKAVIKKPEIIKNEIETLKMLDHPSIIRLYETFEDEKNIFLVTE